MKHMRLATTLLTLIITYCITVLYAMGCETESKPSTQITDVTAQEALGLVQDNENNSEFVIIDVRTPTEFDSGHIENAINIDFNSSDFEEEIDQLDKNKTYLVYCRSGNRSRGAITLMEDLQFKNIYHLYQGIIGWENSGYPTVQ